MINRTDMRVDILKVVVPGCLALVLAACAPAPSNQKTDAQIWEETFRQAAVLRTVEEGFARTHQFKGQPVQAAMHKLTAEGFDCALRYKKLPALKKGSLDEFIIENVPMIYCSKPHVQQEPDDKCHTFWAAFDVDWRDSSRPPEILERELDTSPVKDERYFCRISHGV